MIVGAVNAIIGYVGRVMMYYNPFNFAAFMLQISESGSSLNLSMKKTEGKDKLTSRLLFCFLVCITTGPVYYSAAIYITLALS